MKGKLIAVVALFLALAAPAPIPAQPIHVGKALKSAAKVVSAPVRKPKSAVKSVASFSYTSFLASFEAVGVVLEATGEVVQKIGVGIYDAGSALSGGK